MKVLNDHHDVFCGDFMGMPNFSDHQVNSIAAESGHNSAVGFFSIWFYQMKALVKIDPVCNFGGKLWTETWIKNRKSSRKLNFPLLKTQFSSQPLRDLKSWRHHWNPNIKISLGRDFGSTWTKILAVLLQMEPQNVSSHLKTAELVFRDGSHCSTKPICKKAPELGPWLHLDKVFLLVKSNLKKLKPFSRWFQLEGEM